MDLSNFNNIPQELKDKKQWVVVKFTKRPDGEMNKIPCQINGSLASSTNPQTWTDFNTAVKLISNGHFPALGFVFNNDYTGIDLDKCVKDNKIAHWANKWIIIFNSYTEYSYSKKGMHIILPNALINPGRKKGHYEAYSSSRFFVFTGDIYNNYNKIVPADEQFKQFYTEIFGEEKLEVKDIEAETLNSSLFSDSEILERAKSAKNSDKFNALFDGDIKTYFKLSHVDLSEDEKEMADESISAADAALCSMLAFWTHKDIAQMDRLFRQSKLFRIREDDRDKWDKKHGARTYGEMTIGKAIEACQEVYETFDSYVNSKPESIYFKKFKNKKEAVEWFDNQYALVYSGGSEPVFDLLNKEFSSFVALAKFNQSTYPGTKTIKGIETETGLSAAEAWFYSTRQRYQGLKFNPSNKSLIIQEDNREYLNLYTGYNVEPQEGDLYKLWLDLLLKVICNKNKEMYNYTLAWFAQMIQFPTQRPGVALVMKSDAQGLGKGLLLRWIARILGKHGNRIDKPELLTGRFNKHFMNKIFTFVDEGFWAGDKAGRGTLYGMITEPTIQIEPKGHDPFEIENHTHFVFASNQDWVIPAEMDVRRFAVIDIPSKNKQIADYYTKIADNINPGASHLLYFLLHYDVSDFNLRDIPKNQALLDQKILNLSSFEQFLYERLQNGIMFTLLPKTFDFRTSYPDIDVTVDWPIEILKFDLMQEYLLWSNKTKQRFIKSQDSVGKIMVKLIGVEVGRKSVGMSRPPTYKIPTIENARKTFAQHMGHKIKWTGEEKDTETNNQVVQEEQQIDDLNP